MRAAFALGIVLYVVSAPSRADAFCGFYVEGSGASLYNDATQVVLMREGTRTVLSMQNHYAGPPEAFAMVVPVPVVLAEADVKTLPREVFAKIDAMAAPRLVEYWEQDPCAPIVEPRRRRAGGAGDVVLESGAPRDAGLGVTVEAAFTVGEYDIVVLSARDSTGLDTWLRRERYALPAGAEPLLRPYVEGGWKFFVAKVDPAKVARDGDRTILSPLRFHYDSDELVLPVRLGLINSSGTQDLIVHVLARSRHEVANHPNAFVPTNLDLRAAAKHEFAAFYAALFDRTLAEHPGAVVTEYAWDARSCDPCPGPTLDDRDLATLGGDVIGGAASGFVLTRLHARYGKELDEDLVFRAAAPVAGGREVRDAAGALEQGARPAPVDAFQARYAIRHPWQGPITCGDPRRGRWGGPPEGGAARIEPARDVAFAPRGQVELARLIAGGLPDLDVVTAGAAPAPAPPPVAPATDDQKGCGCAAGGDPHGIALALLALGLVIRRKR